MIFTQEPEPVSKSLFFPAEKSLEDSKMQEGKVSPIVPATHFHALDSHPTDNKKFKPPAATVMDQPAPQPKIMNDADLFKAFDQI